MVDDLKSDVLAVTKADVPFEVRTQRRKVQATCLALIRKSFRGASRLDVVAWTLGRPSKSILVSRYYDWGGTYDDEALKGFKARAKSCGCVDPKKGWLRERLDREALSIVSCR